MKNDDAKNAANHEKRAPDDQIFFAIGTSGDVEKQVGELVDKLAVIG